VGDFNADGNADLVTANDASNNVSVLLGTSSGSFAAAASYPTGPVPKAVAVGDFNGDGKRDVVTANTAGNYPSGSSNPGGDQISLLLGTGTGAFSAPANSLAGNTPFSVAVGQLNEDGALDVATANWYGNNVSVLLNTTGTPPPSGTSYLSDLAWSFASNGWGPVERDMSNGETAAGDGTALTLNGTTYAKGLGVHADSEVRYPLSGCSRFKASVGIDDEVGANGTVVFQVFAGASKVFDSGVLSGTSATQSVDVSISGASELRLLVGQGTDNNWYDHADWAEARIECGSGGGGDTTPPTITATSPANGASGVSVSVSPSASFSEAMDPASLTSSTFTLLKQGQTTPVSASVSYASQVATLDPSSDLEPGTSYTATVKGGSAGAKDVAGNALAADVSWSFTTAAGANQPPVPVIDSPPASLTWKVGDTISFTGHATDPEQGTLPASALSWTLLMQHCPSTCHSHTIQSWPGVASGSSSAPDHEYPSYLELELTATDGQGASASTSIQLQPQTVELSFASSPTGLQLSVNGVSSATPFTRTVIVGSSNSLSATTPQVLDGTTYEFSSWSDGGAQTHNVTAPASATTYTATYVIAPPRNTVLPAITGQKRVGATLTVSNGTWTGSQPMTFTYQWLRCTTTALSSCTEISGATSKTYVATTADYDRRLRARVTATNAGGTGTATSNATSRIR
jgi:hypothetical protein